MSGPFRELFVELLQALLEAAIRQAQAKKSYEPKLSRLSMSDVQSVASVLCRRYEWKNVETFRYAARRETGFGGRMRCGHNFLYRMDDADLLEAPTMLDALDETVKEQPRFCYCTPREAL